MDILLGCADVMMLCVLRIVQNWQISCGIMVNTAIVGILSDFLSMANAGDSEFRML